MKTESRLAQKGFKVLTGQDTRIADKTVASARKVLTIVQAAELLTSGCTLYRLDKTWWTQLLDEGGY